MDHSRYLTCLLLILAIFVSIVSMIFLPQIFLSASAKDLKTTSPQDYFEVSGYTEQAIQNHRVLDAGSDFVSKPVPMQTLLLKIRQILAKP